jgi:O-Antigen ligase
VDVRTVPQSIEAGRFDTTIGIAAGVALGITVGALSNVHSIWASIGMVAAVVIAGAALIRILGPNVGLVALLIVTCLVDRGTVKVGSYDIRAEQIAALLTLAIVGITRFSVRRLSWLRPSLAEGALAAWFGVGLIGTLTAAPSRNESLKVLALLVLSSMGLLLPPRVLERRRKELDEAVRWLLLAGAAEAAYSVAAYSLHWVGLIVSSTVNPGTNLLSAYGTLWEPNVLGAVSAAEVVGWLVLGRVHFKHSWPGVALCLSATIVSFTRAAWLAGALVIVLLLAINNSRQINLRFLARRVVPALALIGVLIIGILAVGDKIGGSFKGRLTDLSRTIGNGTDILGRLGQFNTVLTDLKQNPVFGGGIDSYGQRHMFNGSPEHIANLELAVVNDTGLLGLLIFAAFAALVIVTVWRHRLDSTVIGLAAMTLVIALTNQATETLELMITWLLVGLLLAAIGTAAPINASAAARITPDSDLRPA